MARSAAGGGSLLSRRRLDQELVRRRLARSRTEAAALIDEGRVLVGGIPAPKSATLVAADTPITVGDDRPRFASRGGTKLEAALDAFVIDVTGRTALDAGASTGGFTDCLLRRGARSVLAVDVGYGQLDGALATDPRVAVLDRTNLRTVESEQIGGPFEIVVADLSFISLCTVMPRIAEFVGVEGEAVLLVKPQFEVGRGNVGKRGVVTDEVARAEAVERVIDCAQAAGLGAIGLIRSPITGAKGNVEYLLHLRPAADRSVGAVP